MEKVKRDTDENENSFIIFFFLLSLEARKMNSKEKLTVEKMSKDTYFSKSIKKAERK